jgi:hypothetical protein
LADDPGLYGAGDATYDGAYRQSLSVLALAATGPKVPKSSVRWLKRQQCADGGFMAYRSDLQQPCQAPDTVNFSGQDSNGTALAIAALAQTGNSKQARTAASWIEGKRNADRGYAYYPAPGATSDASSTALTLGALQLVGKPRKASYLSAVQARCDAPAAQRGGLATDTTSPVVNDGATAQAALALGGALELPEPTRIKRATPGLVCSGKNKNKASVLDAALGYLSKRLVAVKGALPYGGGYPGTDYAGTASAALALANAGAGRKAVNTTVRFLMKDAGVWIGASGPDSPGSLALLILVADATGQNPKDFGGINLLQRLAKTQQ